MAKLTTHQKNIKKLNTAPVESKKIEHKVRSIKPNTSASPLNRLTYNNSSVQAAEEDSGVIPRINRIYEVTGETIIVESDKDVYINTVENIVEQKYISNITGGVLQVGEITGTSYSNVANCVSKLGFDTDSGFEVSDFGGGVAKIAMNSTFKCWEVDGTSGLIACGLDTVNFVAGSGVTITSCNTAVPKTLTISSTGGGGTPGGSTGQVQYNNGGSFSGAAGLTYDNITDSVGITKINVPQDQSLEISVSSSTIAWYATYGDFSAAVNNDYSSQVVYDATGNIYIIGSDGNNGVSPFLVKYDSAGNVLWQKFFNEANNYYKTGDAIAVGPDGNLVCIVGTDDTINDVTILKVTPSGTIVWQTTLSGAYIAGTDIILDSSNNVYACMYYANTGNSQLLVKLNSSGVLQWQKELSCDNKGYPFGIALDNSGNILISGRTSDGASQRRLLLTKYDTTGNLLFQYVYNTVAGTNETQPGQITVDSSNNIYIVGRFDPGTGYNSGYVIKLDSSGNIVWQKNFAQSTSSPGYNTLEFYGIALDSTGNVYVAGYGINSPTTTESDLVIAKLSNSGTVLWTRTFGGTSDEYGWYYWAVKMIDVYENNYVVSGYTYSSSSGASADALTLNMPTDGTQLGTYGPYTYAEATFIVDSVAFVKSAGTGIEATGLLSSSTGVYTLISGTLTDYTYKISGGDNVYSINSGGIFTMPYYSLPLNPPLDKQTLVNNNGSVSWNDPSLYLSDSGNLRISSKDNTAGSFKGKNNFAVGNDTFSKTYGYNFSCNNVAIGYGALKCNTNGSDNIVFGCNSLTNVIGGVNNFMAGANVGYCACFSCNNIGVGRCSLYNIVQSHSNVGLGYGTLKNIKNSYHNIAIGCNAASNLCVDNYSEGNVAIGQDSLSQAQCGLYNVAIGVCAMRGASGTHNNIALGTNTLYAATSNSYNNIAIGDGSNYCRLLGDNNIGIGTRSFAYALSGWQNIAIGYESQDTGGHGGAGNISLGYWSLRNVSNAYDNIAIGSQSQYCHVTGNHNITVGYGTLKYNVSGNDNVALGADSQRCNTGGIENISLGSRSLYSNTTGIRNIAVGTYPMYRNTGGTDNIAMGIAVLECNTVGSYNIGLGHAALQNTIQVSQLIAIGESALRSNTTGCCNIAIGSNALRNNTTGYGNIAIGYQASYCSTNAGDNVAIGTEALFLNKVGYRNIAVGNRALKNFNTGGGTDNVAIGVSAMEWQTTGSDNTAVGNFALYCSLGSACNTAVGESALFNTRNVAALGAAAGGNTAVGWKAMCTNTTGCYNTVIGAGTMGSTEVGSYNVVIGAFAGGNMVTGNNNVLIAAGGCNGLSCTVNIGNCIRVDQTDTAIGFQSMNESGPGKALNTTGCNTAIGALTGISNTTGKNNTFLGFDANGPSVTSSNTITLGNSSITCIRSQVTTISALSDQRDKTDVENLPLGLQFILDLRPVKFTWNMRDGGKVGVEDSGFIAQEVAALEDQSGVTQWLDMVGRENPDKLEVKPGKLIPILVKAIQDMHIKFTDEIDKLKAEIATLTGGN